ncbi:putative ankyrin repeat domain-containing protein 20A4 [Cavia porcellus]|uniref:putative ankyrin repeat domain-containing protein 20A4 n=1 Tax=Cavia porcellus TaxID=10141 RepID=UPI002FE18005
MPGIFGSSVPKLHKAARKGDKAKVERLLQKWNTVYRDSKQRTALHYASAYGHPEVVRLLIQKKFDLNAWDSDHDTALIKAVKCYEEDCVSILLEHGANPNIANTKGDTALHYAVYSSKSSLTAKLLSHGADAEAKNKEGLTPLMLALRENRMEAAALLKKTETKNVVNEPESSCSKPSPVNYQATSGDTAFPLDNKKQAEMSKVTARKKDMVFAPGVQKAGELPWDSEKPVDPFSGKADDGGKQAGNRKTKESPDTHLPLKPAVETKDSDGKKAVRVKDALPPQPDWCLASCYETAEKSENLKSDDKQSLATLLESDCAQKNLSSGDPGPSRPVGLLKNCKVALQSIFGEPMPKIHKAARKGNKDRVQFLITAGHVHDRDRERRTALHYASAYGHPEVVTLLVKSKCDINACDSDYDTALIKAVKCYEEGCASILLEHGANLNIANAKGDTALHLSVFHPKSSLTAKLLSHGADAEAKNKEGLTPLMLALRENRMKAAALLKKTETKNVVNEPERKNSQCEKKESSNSDNSPAVVASESETFLTPVVAIKIEAPSMPDITLPGTPSLPGKFSTTELCPLH